MDQRFTDRPGRGKEKPIDIKAFGLTALTRHALRNDRDTGRAWKCYARLNPVRIGSGGWVGYSGAAG